MGPTPGAAPEVVLGLEMGLPSVQVLEEAFTMCWAGTLWRCGAADCCSWLMWPELLRPLVGADRLLPEHTYRRNDGGAWNSASAPFSAWSCT